MSPLRGARMHNSYPGYVLRRYDSPLALVIWGTSHILEVLYIVYAKRDIESSTVTVMLDLMISILEACRHEEKAVCMRSIGLIQVL